MQWWILQEWAVCTPNLGEFLKVICLLKFFLFFLFLGFFSVCWGDEVSLPSSWSPGANSVIPRIETHPTSHFSPVQHAFDFFFSLFTPLTLLVLWGGSRKEIKAVVDSKGSKYFFSEFPNSSITLSFTSRYGSSNLQLETAPKTQVWCHK